MSAIFIICSNSNCLLSRSCWLRHVHGNICWLFAEHSSVHRQTETAIRWEGGLYMYSPVRQCGRGSSTLATMVGVPGNSRRIRRQSPKTTIVASVDRA